MIFFSYIKHMLMGVDSAHRLFVFFMSILFEPASLFIYYHKYCKRFLLFFSLQAFKLYSIIIIVNINFCFFLLSLECSSKIIQGKHLQFKFPVMMGFWNVKSLQKTKTTISIFHKKAEIGQSQLFFHISWLSFWIRILHLKNNST